MTPSGASGSALSGAVWRTDGERGVLIVGALNSPYWTGRYHRAASTPPARAALRGDVGPYFCVNPTLFAIDPCLISPHAVLQRCSAYSE